MLNVMGIKSKITGAIALGLTCLPATLHYAATGYLEVERYAAGTLNYAKLETLRFMGLQPIQSQQSIDDMIDAAADEHGVRRELLHAVVSVESRKNPTAVSNKGAIGLSQVMPANAKRCGLPHHGRLYLESENLRCGAQILSEELKTYGNVPDALRAYNGGPKAIKGKFPESEQYVVKVMAELGRRIAS